MFANTAVGIYMIHCTTDITSLKQRMRIINFFSQCLDERFSKHQNMDNFLCYTHPQEFRSCLDRFNEASICVISMAWSLRHARDSDDDESSLPSIIEIHPLLEAELHTDHFFQPDLASRVSKPGQTVFFIFHIH